VDPVPTIATELSFIAQMIQQQKKYYLYSILKYKDLTSKSTSISPRIRAQTKTEDVVRFPFDDICLRNGRFCWNWGGGLLPWNEILAIRTNTYFISTEHR
jgi:hypothetical protein